MIKVANLSLPLGFTEQELLTLTAKHLHISCKEIKHWKYIKKSVDARKKNKIHFVITIAVTLHSLKLEDKILQKIALNNTISHYEEPQYLIPSYHPSEQRPTVVGFGPAGMFAAYILARAGLKPIVLERGASVDERQKTVQHFFKTGCLDTETNVQFGEGGAGTFSDGKLNTGVHDPRVRLVLKLFVKFGAPNDILYTAKPHIGTDCLINVVQNIRSEIIKFGGEVHFHAKFLSLQEENHQLQTITYLEEQKKRTIRTNACILAIGHSARDVFYYLQEQKVSLEAKNFAVGVRIEHLQEEINRSLYGTYAGDPNLPAADYKLAIHLPSKHSLYTFCMCPGGYVVASTSEQNRLVVNGMSYRKRDGMNANSALLVGVSPCQFDASDPLAGLRFQEKIESDAFIAGGKNYSAPVCCVGDFLSRTTSTRFGIIKPTYRPGVTFASPDLYLPSFVTETLRNGILAMGKKLHGFDHPDAILTGVESRSSSPIRILRNPSTLQSVSLNGLYPCGEGAGYAGGITSAAVDGIRCAEMILKSCNSCQMSEEKISF